MEQGHAELKADRTTSEGRFSRSNRPQCYARDKVSTGFRGLGVDEGYR